MTSEEQRKELQRKIWSIANEVRGAVDGWDFKQYVLGSLFYRFISENFASHMEGDDPSVKKYSDCLDSEITSDTKHESITIKGYFIYPSQLFCNVIKKSKGNENLNIDLANIFKSIEESASGYNSEKQLKGLFTDFDTTSRRLGNTVKDRSARLYEVLKKVGELEFGKFEDSKIDLFGDAYEFLISNYAANAGKSGGEFFTPQTVSKLIAKIALYECKRIDKIYDPAAGSGSLLLQAKKQLDNSGIRVGFYGQEINHTTQNLARMNMFLHNVNFDKFEVALGDTLINPYFRGEKFDAIVSNPPYSVNWIGSDDPTLINDGRFAPASVLAPKSKADFAFIMHSLSYLASGARAAIVCFPGIFYRGGAEKHIREYLVHNGFVESVISLPANLFFGTSIAVTILVLKRGKLSPKTQFIDASTESFFKKETNNNILTDDNIDLIMKYFSNKEDIPHISKMVDIDDIAKNDYNLSVSSYVEAKSTKEDIDINKLNDEINETVLNINSLREGINKIIEDLNKND